MSLPYFIILAIVSVPDKSNGSSLFKPIGALPFITRDFISNGRTEIRKRN